MSEKLVTRNESYAVMKKRFLKRKREVLPLTNIYAYQVDNVDFILQGKKEYDLWQNSKGEERKHLEEELKKKYKDGRKKYWFSS